MRLMRVSKYPELHDKRPDCAASAMFGLPFSDEGRSYYYALGGPALIDYSFCIEEKGEILAWVECDLTTPNILTRFCTPIEIWVSPTATPQQWRHIIRDSLAELQLIAKTNQLDEIHIVTSGPTDPHWVTTAHVAKAGGVPKPLLRVSADLALSDEALMADFRQGHRQQSKWGKENLQIGFVDKETPDEETYHKFRQLHADVAGRVTRNIDSWMASYNLIINGHGDLILSYLNDELVGGTLVMDSACTAYYAVGAYRRDLFDKPLGHYPITLAMTRARTRGRAYFDIGEVPAQGSNAPEKEFAIGHFKSGFSNRMRAGLSWILPVKAG